MYISNTFPGNLRWRLLLDYIYHGVTISVVLKNLYTVVSVVFAEKACNIGSNVQRKRQISNINKVTHPCPFRYSLVLRRRLKPVTIVFLWFLFGFSRNTARGTSAGSRVLLEIDWLLLSSWDTLLWGTRATRLNASYISIYFIKCNVSLNSSYDWSYLFPFKVEQNKDTGNFRKIWPILPVLTTVKRSEKCILYSK